MNALMRGLIATVIVFSQPISNANAATYLFHNDHLGTPQALTDSDQQVVWQSAQDPFGEVEAVVTVVEQNLRFAGQYFDVETGLHYNYFRDYDSSIGRYVESDPIGLAAGLNTFSYVSNTPITSIDPYGLKDKGVRGGRCCNYTKRDQWVVVKGTDVDGTGIWEKVAPGSCSDIFDDCDGMTCRGGFYKAQNYINRINAVACGNKPEDPSSDGESCNYEDRRWTPGANTQSPLDKGVRTGDSPPSANYPWAEK